MRLSRSRSEEKKKISGRGQLKLSGKARADLLNLKSTIEASSNVILEEAEIENYGFKTLEVSVDYSNGSIKLNQFQIVYSDDGKISIQPTTFNGQALFTGDVFAADIPIGVLFESPTCIKFWDLFMK